MMGWTAAAILSIGLAVQADPSRRRLIDLDERSVDPFADVDARAIVFVFVRPDCPVSNRYAPELGRLGARFAARGVTFKLVYVGRDASTQSDAVRRHLREYGFSFDALRDPDFSFVDGVGASVTPEVALFDDRRTLRYAGRIDDRYISLARPRPAPTRRDLEEALDAILADRPVATERTAAVGCLISDLR